MSSTRDFGPFGSGGNSSPDRRRRRIQKTLTILLLFSLGALIPVAYVGWSEVYSNFLEKVAPNIRLQRLPIGLGEEPLRIDIDVSDLGAGLDEVVVRTDQDGDVKEVLRRRYKEDRINDDVISLNLPGRDSGLREGKVTIIVAAFDRSFWVNRRQVTFDLDVDYRSPEIELLTTQHNATHGGTQLVFYRLVDSAETLSGIKVSSWLFPGFQAKDLDPSFEYRPDVYFAFFAIPLEFNPKKDNVRLFARDAVGNISLKPLNYKVKTIKQKSATVQLKEEFLKKRVDQLYREYNEKLRVTDPTASLDNILPAANDAELVSRFKAVNENYRELILRGLQPLFARPKPVRLWTKRFVRFSGKNIDGEFGDRQKYRFRVQDAGSQRLSGVNIAAKKNSEVRAANSGVVIFSDELGVYGKTVIVDHGFGLHTLYAHLSSLQRSEGDRLDRGDLIGDSGDTGLALGGHLHYEVRLHGVPVRPEEWWDKNWLRENVEQKINDTKKLLGLSTGRFLD